MGRLKRHSIHTRELTANDWALPTVQNSTTVYQTADSGTDFFNLPSSPAGIAVTDNSAMTVSAVYSCIEKIAVIASLPKHIYEKTADGRQRVDHPYWDYLNTEAAPAWAASSFWERMITMMLLRGDGLAEIVRPFSKSDTNPGIAKIVPLNRAAVWIYQDGSYLKYRVTHTNGKTYVLDQSDVLHFPGFSFNGFHGMSVIQHAARTGVGISLAASQYSAEFFGNNARPDYVLATDGTLTKDQTVATRDAIDAQHRGVGNRFKPLVLQGGLKVMPLNMTPEDSQLLETRKFSVIDVCMAFGVPPQLIGAQDSTAGWAGSSLEQLNLGFTKYTLRGHIARFTQEINRKLFKNTPYFCEFNLDAFLEGDSASQAAYFSKAVGGPGSQGWMTVNEVRKIMNMPADDNADFDSVIQSGTQPQGFSNDPATA